MKYRRLGKTELSVSAVGVGTWQLAGVWGKHFEQPEVDTMFSRARDLGLNFVDTAECYGDHLAEEMVGNGIADHREDWIVATKFGHDHNNGLADENYTPKQVLIQLHDSLRALRTDYIDVYQMHSGSNALFDNDELWTTLDKQVVAGKIRFLGNSIGWPQNRKQVLKSEKFGISVIQTIYNAVNRVAEEGVLVAAGEQDLGVIARVPLASGFLTGKYNPGDVFAANDVRSMRPQQGIDKEISAAQQFLAEKPPGISAAVWASQWCLRHPQIATVIPGAKSLAQLEENVLAGEFTL